MKIFWWHLVWQISYKEERQKLYPCRHLMPQKIASWRGFYLLLYLFTSTSNINRSYKEKVTILSNNWLTSMGWLFILNNVSCPHTHKIRLERIWDWHAQSCACLASNASTLPFYWDILPLFLSTLQIAEHSQKRQSLSLVLPCIHFKTT